MPSFKTNFGIEEIFRQHVRAQPLADAVVEGSRTLSYQQLDNLAGRLSAQLQRYAPKCEEPVGILLPGGIASIAAQIAIIRAGATCVPLDLAFPDQRIVTLYEKLQVRVVFTLSIEAHRFKAFEHIFPEGIDDEKLDDDIVKDAIISTGERHRTHILHTSGTTGQPKPVEIESRGVYRIARNTHATQMLSSDRVAQIAAPSFDAILHEVWATLLVGGAVIILPKKVALDPWALYNGLITHRVTSIMITTTLLAHTVSVIPHAFASLEVVITVGEAANPQVLQKIFENGAPKKLLNGYGPTECTTVATFHHIQMEDCQRGIIPIGKPLDDTTLYILDRDLVPVQGDQIGEIYLGGIGVARGYLNLAEATAKSFVQVDGLSESGEPERLYKTGDLGRYLDGGVVDFVGRTDRLIKLRGFSVDFVEVESVIMKSDLVRSVLVTPVERPGKDRYIVAFIIPKHPGLALSAKLDAYMKQYLPVYMIPRVEVLSEFPMTSHGKADQKLLISAHMNAIDDAEKDLRSLSESDSGSTALWLQYLWTSVLGVSHADMNSNFFDLGGSSLQAAALLVHIRRRFDMKISIQQIYDHPILSQLAKLLDQDIVVDTAETPKLEMFLDDARLADNIDVLSGAVPNWQHATEGRIFVTGATGFLGAHFLRDMIDRSDVQEIRCLVRAANSRAARDRLLSTLRDFNLHRTKNLHKITAVPGDLGEDCFGLEALEFNKLAAWASVIFHIGARVNYVQPYGSHRPSNVLGTLTCIKLATTSRPKALHHISSVGISGPISYFRDVGCVTESCPLTDFQDSLPYDLGYTQSKWVSESLVQSFIAKGGAAVVYRPGFIMGDSERGTFNCTDFMARFLLGCLKIGYRPMLPRHSKLMVPANFVTAAMIHISADAKNYNQTFHVVPQTPHDDIDLESTWELLASIGYHLRAVPYPEWLELLSQDCDMLKNPLLSLLPVLQETVYDGLTLMELYEDMAAMDTNECRHALADMDPAIRSGVDLAFLDRYMKSLTAVG